MKQLQSRYLKEMIIFLLLTIFLFNFLQSYKTRSFSIKSILFLGVYAVFLLSFLYFLNKSWKSRGIIFLIIKKFMVIPMPPGAKIIVAIVVSGNLISIGIGEARYPFYDVGMFRWSSTFSNPDKMMYVPKYYYKENGKVKILDLRKEGISFLAEHLGLGYTQEFTFAAAYHNKGQKENFEFISDLMKKKGIDSLWVGVQIVNYADKEVKFDPDICNAIKINATKKIYYGPIYIPEPQKIICDNGF